MSTQYKRQLTCCNAKTAVDWNRSSDLKSWAISLTSLWKGAFLMSNSVDVWYLRISRRATVPGRYLCGFLTPPVVGADFLAALVASCFRGALPPVDFLAVCFVLAMFPSFPTYYTVLQSLLLRWKKMWPTLCLICLSSFASINVGLNQFLWSCQFTLLNYDNTSQLFLVSTFCI